MKSALVFLWHLATCLAAQPREYLPPPDYDEAVDNGTYGFYPTRSYSTAEDVKAPETNFLQWDSQCDDGMMYFITPRGYSLPRPGPMILDRRGELVWAHHFENKFGGQAYDFMVQEYKGEDYLTFWLGDDRVRGHGSGFYYLLNSSYDIVHKVGGANGMSADLHEFLILPEGTALMTIYEIIPGDVSAFREFDPEKAEDRDPNYVWDGAFQEIDIETGELVFEWRASEHYEISETYRPIYNGGTKVDPWDWFHINSMVKDELGNYLISARYTHSITYIDGKTKEIIWQLGGKRNMFLDQSGGNATNFAWQHDARFVDTDTFPNLYTPPDDRPGFTTKLVSLFDNAAEDQHYHFGLPLSRGLLLEVTYPTPGTEKAMAGPVKGGPQELPMKKEGELTPDDRKLALINGSDPDYTVRLIKSYENPNWIRSSSQGSMQVLPQGPGADPKVFVGYGLNAAWTEFDSNGTVLCDVHFAASTSFERGDVQSYRAYKFPWVGRPETKPSVEITDDDAEVLVSWKGATEVADWVLQASDTKSDDDKEWADLQSVPKHLFETAIPVSANVGDSRYLRVIALSESGRRLDHGTSKIIDRGIMASYFPSINKKLPERVSHVSVLKLFLMIAASVSLVFVLYELYRKYLSWRYGRLGGGGPLMFRKGPVYRLLGEA
ncbi:hypothetical protein LTR37_007935 [Vermiconidia calcicola]|uniref:Uncharacterized protein n=1 Tax=Vermiconidia calcicola TaxID=1690605 RepID=A0ACC3NDL9_9PEZI|nr:hypothetical protein LTR37_007935 [Vermiconidia calcicola]